MHHKNSLFERLICMEHIFLSWDRFVIGKRKRSDVQLFTRRIEDHLFGLHEELAQGVYQHGPYERFYVFEPKERHISKASVRDRLVHHMVRNLLCAIYEARFFFHSYSCRAGKGTHAGVSALVKMLRKASLNNRRPVYGLKLDIKRFFDRVDHSILKGLLTKTIDDSKVLHLMDLIIDSFSTSNDLQKGLSQRGLPLGNVTSQIFANIYLHELDLYLKHDLKVTFYLRYCDDLMLISANQEYLKQLIGKISAFLDTQLKLQIHPQKVSLRKWSSGIDFLGYLSFSHYKLVRQTTKKRIYRRLRSGHTDFLQGVCDQRSFDQRLQSYLGVMRHANQHQVTLALKNAYLTRDPPVRPSFDYFCHRPLLKP